MKTLILLFNTPSINEWAAENLNASERSQFTEMWVEFDGQLAYGVITGEITRTQVFESVRSTVLDCDIDMHIGNRFDIPDFYWDNTINQNTITWFDRYTADTGNTFYQWL